MILVWGLRGDDPTSAVTDALARLGGEFVFFDQESVIHSQIELSTIGPDVKGSVANLDQKIDLATVTAAYLRPYDSRQLLEARGFLPTSKEWERAILLEEVLSTWSEITPALVVNRPSKMASNSSKPYQSAIIRSFGFSTPDTLVTTDPKAVLDFMECHGRIIYKSISGIRSIVSSFTDEHLARLNDVSWCPTQFQEYIRGVDYRVHVVGTEVFPCKITSAADDYRYSSRQGSDLRIEPCTLAPDVADRCVQISVGMGLAVSGVDLRQAEDGTWYCFEVNPSPGFTYYQERTGQLIGESIARLLINGSKRYGRHRAGFDLSEAAGN